MSIFSDEEENELINFENLEILDLFEDDSDFDTAECIDINSGKKKIILIKMSKSIKTKTSDHSKSHNGNPKKEEIHELKYNLYLGLIKGCVPEVEKYKDIIKDRNLIGHRVIIQKIVIDKERKFFHPKKYIFMPPNKNKDLYFTINENEVLKISKGENVTMQLGKGSGSNFEKTIDLKKLDEEANPDIANKIAIKPNDKISENNNNPINEININFDKIKEGSESINSEFEIKSEKSISIKSRITNGSKLSKLDSSEKEIELGELFYYEIKEGTEYMRYSYYDEYKKEIDGIYYEHPAIKLENGKKELNFDDYRSYKDFENKYDIANKKNDLNGYIIMKNFEDETIPKDAPFIIEIKAGFQLIELLKQIKKASKYVNNLQNYDGKLPKYFIGILCSFSNEITLMNQFTRLNKYYNGSNSEDKDSKINLLTHITKIIGKNINFVIAVLKDGKINDYVLSKNDYDINNSYKRVDLLYMYKTINKIDNISKEDLEEIEKKISSVSQKFSKAYYTFNDEKLFSTSYSKKIEYEKKFKEQREKIQEERNKLEEEWKEMQKERKEMVEERKEMVEERKKMQEKIQEERNKMEEERKEMQKERKEMVEERKEMVEERKKMQEKIQEERNKMEEERKEMQKERKEMEEERKEMQKERKEMQNERNKTQEEFMKKMQEKMQEDLMKKIQEKMEEERSKMQEELMKKIQDGRKETEKKEMPEEIKSEKKKMLEKKENKKIEYRSKTEQAPENQEWKK